MDIIEVIEIAKTYSPNLKIRREYWRKIELLDVSRSLVMMHDARSPDAAGKEWIAIVDDLTAQDWKVVPTSV